MSLIQPHTKHLQEAGHLNQVFIYLFSLFRAIPTANGSSQARGGTGAIAAD